MHYPPYDLVCPILAQIEKQTQGDFSDRLLGMTEGLRDTWKDFEKNTQPYKQIIVPLRGFSTEVAQDFHREIDLLFIDGDHSYDGCKTDCESWLPKVKTEGGGLIILHDFGWAEGVKKVVQEMVIPKAMRYDNLPNMFWAWIQ